MNRKNTIEYIEARASSRRDSTLEDKIYRIIADFGGVNARELAKILAILINGTLEG